MKHATGRKTRQLNFHAIAEDSPGPRLKARLDRYWPSYRRWFLREGDAARPRYAECLRALRTHMPELIPVYESLVDLAGGSDTAARFLSLWRPTPYLAGCSQAVWDVDSVALIRNYDYAPHLCDGIILCSRFLNDATTIAMTDCIWGVLDGVNSAGVAVALAFGGRKVFGEGFGVPLVLRYALELADSTQHAVRILKRVPVHMAYNVSVVDATGSRSTVMLSPDRDAIVTQHRVATNHQERVEWPAHAALTETVERRRLLDQLLDDRSESLRSLTARFLEPPLFRNGYDRGWGTLYTAVYRPESTAVEYAWPGRERMVQSCGDFQEQTFRAVYRLC